jgi:U3 small nucleolar RNA-associated protein 14
MGTMRGLDNEDDQEIDSDTAFEEIDEDRFIEFSFSHQMSSSASCIVCKG